MKRGSLLAALVNGTPVVPRISGETPEELTEVVLAADSVEEARGCVARLVRDTSFAEEMGMRGLVFAERFSWDRIAEAHESLYRASLTGKRTPSREQTGESLKL